MSLLANILIEDWNTSPLTGDALKQLRLDLKLSQDELARLLEISADSITQFERGTQDPSRYESIALHRLAHLSDKEAKAVRDYLKDGIFPKPEPPRLFNDENTLVGDAVYHPHKNKVTFTLVKNYLFSINEELTNESIYNFINTNEKVGWLELNIKVNNWRPLLRRWVKQH